MCTSRRHDAVEWHAKIEEEHLQYYPPRHPKSWAAYPARSPVQERWQALKLSRRNKAAALAFASLCIWMSTGWTLRLQVLLLGALTVRCNLKPAEASSLLWLVPMSHVHILREQPPMRGLSCD